MTKSVAPIVLYTRQMEEIKKRVEVIKFLLDQQGSALYVQPTVESICLQFRKVLELIAFSSLTANRQAYEAVHKDFASHHKADILLKELRRINPLFYPVPISQRPKEINGVMVPDLITSGILTQEDYIDVFKKCGRLLHAPNPFGGTPSIAFYQKAFPIWLGKIVRLLNTHEVHLVTDPTMWIINMQEDGDDRVHYYVFEETSIVDTLN